MSKETTAFQVLTFSDCQKFLEASESLLLEHEAESNLLWEVGRSSARNQTMLRPWVGWLVKSDEKSLLAALPSSTGYLILSGGEPGACLPLARHLSKHGVSAKGVSGPESVSGSFAEAWLEVVGGFVVPGAELSFYLATTETELTGMMEGVFRQARSDEEAKLRAWAIDFGAESPRPMDPSSLVALSERMLESGDLFVWEDGEELVAMGGFGRETPHGLVVNMIYVPPNRRGRGFAGALTTGLMAEATGRGKSFCCLYSEFRSSVRTNLYERIGFRLAGEFTERAFSS